MEVSILALKSFLNAMPICSFWMSATPICSSWMNASGHPYQNAIPIRGHEKISTLWLIHCSSREDART